MTDRAETALEGAIRRPDNPRHMMVLKPIGQRVRVHAGGKLVADSANALYLLEMFNKALNPVIYIPATDITADLETIDNKATHCPLKGDASYYGIDGEEIGWVYNDPFKHAEAIKGFHAFWPKKVRTEIGE